eukprot:g50487.t1
MNEKNRLASTRLTQRPWELHDKTISSNLTKLRSGTNGSFFWMFSVVNTSWQPVFLVHIFFSCWHKSVAAKPSPHLFNLWVQVGTKLTAFMSSLSTFFNFSLLFSTSSRLLALILSSSILSQPVFFLPPSYSFSPSARL